MDEYRSSTSESISCFFAAAVSAFAASRSSFRMHEARCRCRVAPVAGSTVNSSADGSCSSRALSKLSSSSWPSGGVDGCRGQCWLLGWIATSTWPGSKPIRAAGDPASTLSAMRYGSVIGFKRGDTIVHLIPNDRGLFSSASCFVEYSLRYFRVRGWKR